MLSEQLQRNGWKTLGPPVHVPGMCCTCEWAPVDVESLHPSKRHYREFCVSCGALCLRDKRGKVVEFEADVDYNDPR